MEINDFYKNFNSSTNYFLMKNDIFNNNNTKLNSSYNPFLQMNEDNPSNSYYRNYSNGQQINYNKIINNNFNINNNTAFNNMNHTAYIEKSSTIINHTNKIFEIFNSKNSLLKESSSINANNNPHNVLSLLKSKKIKIDLRKKKYKDNIKSILDNLIKCEEKYNKVLKENSKIFDRNCSLCYIISKTFVDDFKLIFNYDYYKQKNSFNSKIILKQRKNNPKI